MERAGGAYAAAGLLLAVGAYFTSGIARLVLIVLAALPLLAAAWIAVWAFGLTLFLRMIRGGG
jgi:hypothetical protein